jgi:hypothetical protein
VDSSSSGARRELAMERASHAIAGGEVGGGGASAGRLREGGRWGGRRVPPFTVGWALPVGGFTSIDRSAGENTYSTVEKRKKEPF